MMDKGKSVFAGGSLIMPATFTVILLSNFKNCPTAFFQSPKYLAASFFVSTVLSGTSKTDGEPASHSYLNTLKNCGSTKKKPVDSMNFLSVEVDAFAPNTVTWLP